MSFLRIAAGAAVLALLLAGCGDTRPFAGAPGATARRLAQPPPSRLAVAAPTAALLPDDASLAFSGDVVAALVDREVPAVAGPPRVGDWQLVLSADLHGDKVLPAYTVQDPQGVAQGTAQGRAVDAGSWSAAGANTLKDAAQEDAEAIASLLTSIDAARQRSDPNSLVNRPAKIFLKSVSGAPGDGNQSLALAMRRKLPKLGETMPETAEEADFVIEGKCKATPGASGTTQIELQWIITDAQGRERGRIIQLNEVPPEAVSSYWGDVAAVAAQEAAGGIRDVIVKQTGAKQPDAKPDAKPGEVAGPPA